MSYRIFLQIYHILLQKSSYHLDCAGLQPHVPAAYVGRPGSPNDLEQPFYHEEACRRVGTVLGSELPDFPPNSQRTCEDWLAWEAPCRDTDSNSRALIRDCEDWEDWEWSGTGQKGVGGWGRGEGERARRQSTLAGALEG
jgi:hypothetical protein